MLAPLTALISGHLATVRTEFGRFTRQVSGYSLEHLLPENGTDVAKFLVGTEGTLALTLRATVRLVAAPKATTLAVLGYADMAAAAEAVPALLPHLPVALEGLDSRLVDVVRTRRGSAAVPDLPRGGGWLFVETAGDTPRRLATPQPSWSPTAPASTARSSPAATPPRCGASGRTARASAAARPTALPPGRAGRTAPCRRTSCPATCGS